MTMRYCQGCGSGHECEADEAGREKAEVAIARLETTRDIEVARITSAAGIKVAESEATQAAAHAEGVEEGIGAVLDAATPDAPEGDGPPIVIQPEAPEPDAEAGPEMTPPEVVTPPPAETGGKGWWGGYR